MATSAPLALLHPEPPDNPRQLPSLTYEFVLPFPPSVNRLWRYVGRGKVIKSPEYDAWLKDCDGYVLEQLGIPAYRRPIRGKYVITIELDGSRFGKVDQDNCAKAVSDLCQRAGLVANDKNAWETHILWRSVDASHEKQAVCHVSIRPI